MPNLENLTGAIEQLFQDINRERTFSIIRHNQFLKILNEIEADKSGTITKIHAQNAQAVEYGSALFDIE